MANGVTAVTFDPLSFVKRLTNAGLSVEVAETLATEQSHFIEQVSAKLERAASRREFKEHKIALKEYKSDLRDDLKRLEVSLRKDNEILRKELESRFEVLRTEITWTKWILSVLVAGVFLPFLKGLFLP